MLGSVLKALSLGNDCGIGRRSQRKRRRALGNGTQALLAGPQQLWALPWVLRASPAAGS